MDRGIYTTKDFNTSPYTPVNAYKKRPSYALVIYDGDIHDQIETLEVDADFVVALPDNGRGDLGEEIPKGGYKIFFD